MQAMSIERKNLLETKEDWSIKITEQVRDALVRSEHRAEC